jgi:hypothetical protein
VGDGHRPRKNGSAVLFDIERKHLTPRQMQRLLEAVQGRRNEAATLGFVSYVSGTARVS